MHPPAVPAVFDESPEAYKRALADLRAELMRRYPHLLAIMDLPVGPATTSAELFARYGFKDYIPVLLDKGGVDDGTSMTIQWDGVGGMLFFAKHASGSVHPLLFVKTGEPGPANRMAAVKVLSLLHEAGHVDDYEKGLNIILNRMRVNWRRH